MRSVSGPARLRLPPTVSLTLGVAAVEACGVAGGLVLADAEGGVVFLAPGSGVRRVVAHRGPVLAMAPHPDGFSVVTGGDDGGLCRTQPDGSVETLARFNGRWVHAVATSTASGAVACAVDRVAGVVGLRKSLRDRGLEHGSAVGGLAFDPKGRRLAVAHYGGVSLWWIGLPDMPATPLKWRGSHLTATWSPCGRFLVTAMQEAALHGWRVADGRNMHMSGYASKVRSMAWSRDGRWLTTSGSEVAVCWPFTGRDGPMDREPRQLGPPLDLVTRVATCPSQPLVAIGYEFGRVIVCRQDGSAEAEIAADVGSPVTALAWGDEGRMLGFAREDGTAGLVNAIS